MKYTNLGRTGLKVSRLALGTMNFGQKTSEEESHAILDRAMDMGINLVDTADIYGYRKAQGTGAGWTEEIIGRWLAHESGRRERIVLATKVFSRMGNGVNDQGLSALHICRACEDSLRRLQTDHIDLWVPNIHRPPGTRGSGHRRSCRQALVVRVETADFDHFGDDSKLRRLYRTRHGRIQR